MLRVCVEQVQKGEGNQRFIKEREDYCNRGGWNGASVSDMVVGGLTCSTALKDRQMMVCDGNGGPEGGEKKTRDSRSAALQPSLGPNER